MKKNTKKILGVALLVVLIAAFALLWNNFSEKPVEGSKAITIEVIDDEAESTVYELKTDAEYLRQAMEEADGLEFSATDGMVDTVNGVKADYNVDASYWAFYINDEYCNYGIDEQPVEDGDAFKIVYTK